MKRLLHLAACLLLCCIVLVQCKTEKKLPQEKPAHPVAVEDFFKDPERAGYRISPVTVTLGIKNTSI